jgi:serine/threonine protein kinase
MLTGAQLCEVAKGIYYLHEQNVIHGDIRGVLLDT